MASKLLFCPECDELTWHEIQPKEEPELQYPGFPGAVVCCLCDSNNYSPNEVEWRD